VGTKGTQRSTHTPSSRIAGRLVEAAGTAISVKRLPHAAAAPAASRQLKHLAALKTNDELENNPLRNVEGGLIQSVCVELDFD
jgi:hypothetical protein